MIKILTILGNNYGGCLQAYALEKKIRDLGHCNVEIINYTQYLNKRLNVKKVFRSIIYYNRNKKYNLFRRKYCSFGKKVTKLIDDGSIYIVGSDQVWNQRIDIKYRKKFFLDFVNDKKRKNTYAASIGDIEIDKNEENRKKIKQYLQEFNFLSVREHSSIELLKTIVNVDIVNVLDPTLLLSTNEWFEIVPKLNENNNILVYTLGLEEDNIKIIDHLCRKENMKIRDIFYKKRFKESEKILNSLGPIEFISEIASTKFVITNSFHGTVFSILNHKEFLVITREKMNSRIYDLLNILGIKNRIFDMESLKEISSIKELEAIDYNEVDKKIDKLRKKSIDYLKNIVELEGSD